ncbi:unnamed protein product [Caenorhabditis bovis]|uniref:Uncharacterized protein n=1 Tax=Caenorhabditis bovis TaxID=2654633 RepID=A0A8S1F8T7_9PELO|nr:unnamed protein product [Caenorhabditis bovis]
MVSQLVCPPKPPDYYVIVLRIIASISIPVSCFAFYLVWFRSQKRAKYRYCLFYVQISTFLSEIFISILPAYYYFPMLGGFNTSSIAQYVSGHSYMAYTATVTVSILNDLKVKMSRQTYATHASALFGLIMQLAVGSIKFFISHKMPSQLVCPTNIPDYYLNVLHSIACVSFPFNLLAFYLVWYRSPKASNYRYCLFYLQLTTLIAEIDMTIMNPRYYFFPMLGSYNNSWLSEYVSSHLATCLYFFLLCWELPAYLICFLYRYESTIKMDKYYPNCKHIMLSREYEFYDYRVNPWIAGICLSAFLFVFISALYMIYLASVSIRVLINLKKHMSQATFVMHKTAMISLIMQN